MRQETGVFNPDTSAIDAAVESLRGKSREAIEGEVRDSANGVATALEEMAGSYDWKRANSLGGSTAADRIPVFKAKLAQRVAGEKLLVEMRDADREKAANEAALAAIESGQIGDTAHSDRPTDNRQGTVSRPAGRTAVDIATNFTNSVAKAFKLPADVTDQDDRIKGWCNKLRNGVTLDVNPGDLFLPGVSNVMTNDPDNGMLIWPQQSSLIIPAVGRNPYELINVIPRMAVTSDKFEYRVEDGVPNVAASAYAEVNENSAFAKSDYDWDEASVDIRKLGSITEMSLEQVEDERMLAGLISRLMQIDLRRRIDRQALLGDNAKPNIMGLQHGLTPTVFANPGSGKAYGVDQLKKQATKIRTVGYTSASHHVMHAEDWSDTEISRDDDGRLLFGNEQGTVRPMAYGTPVIESLNQTKGSVLTCDIPGFALMLTRNGIKLDMSDSDGTNFGKGVISLRIYTRLAVARFRTEAFQLLTGYQDVRSA